MTRVTPRRPNSRPAPRRRPVWCFGAFGAARWWRTCSPGVRRCCRCRRTDERETSLLTTSLRAGSEIDDEVAVVVSTSGTTGTPKGAMLTASALTASAEATHDRLGGAGRWLLALPAYHVAGLQVLVRSVVAGTTPVAIVRGFLCGGTGLGRRFPGFGATVRVTGGGAAGQVVGGPSAAAALGVVGRGADRRRTDAGRCRRKSLGRRVFPWCGRTG